MNHQVLQTLHSGYTVKDVQRLSKFFFECFGFQVTEPRTAPRLGLLGEVIGVTDADALIVYVTAPGHVIELLQYLKPSSKTESAPRPCDVGFSHLSFLVSNVAATADAARRYGFKLGGGLPTIPTGPHQGRRAAYLRDADGFTIEIMGE